MRNRFVGSLLVLGVLSAVGACGSSSKNDVQGSAATAGASGSGGSSSGSSSASGSPQGGSAAVAGAGGSVAGTASGGTAAESGAGGAEMSGEGGGAGEPEIPVECGMIAFALTGVEGGPALCEDVCSEDWLSITDPKGKPMGGAYPPVGCTELFWMSKVIGSVRPLPKCIAGTYHATMCAHLDPDAEAPATGGVTCEPKGERKCVEVEFEATATEVVGMLQ